MNDMSSAIEPKSDQINADDLIGGEMTITINKVEIKGGQEQPVSIFFDGSEKAFRPCKSMSRVLVAAWGADAKKYVGRSLKLYRDPSVKWGGLEVGGIRIREMTDIDTAMTMALTATKGSRKPFTVKPLTVAPAKADKAADGTRELIAKLQKAGPGKEAETILTSAEVVKQRAWLADKRPELAAQVDAAVAALEQADESPFSNTETGPAAVELPDDEAVPPTNAGEAAAPVQGEADEQEGKPDEDRGEAHSGAEDADDAHPARKVAEKIIAAIGKQETEDDLDSLLKIKAFDIEAMPEDMAAEVANAVAERRDELKGEK